MLGRDNGRRNAVGRMAEKRCLAVHNRKSVVFGNLNGTLADFVSGQHEAMLLRPSLNLLHHDPWPALRKVWRSRELVDEPDT